MNEVDRVMYKLGYYDADPAKAQEIKGYIDEATEFMASVGVPADKMTSQRAHAVKSIWAECRDRGEPDAIVKRDGMVIALIAQMRR